MSWDARGNACRTMVPRRGRLSKDERALGLGELRAQVGRELPGRVARRLGRGSEDERREEHDERREARGRARRGYCAISTPSCAAACETCPAIAVARSCASLPSVSACSGAKRFPACSRAWSCAMKARRSASSCPV